MIIQERVRTFTFTEDEMKALLEASDIICKVADEMYEDEVVENDYGVGGDAGDLHDISSGIRKMALDGKLRIVAD